MGNGYHKAPAGVIHIMLVIECCRPFFSWETAVIIRVPIPRVFPLQLLEPLNY